MTTEMAPTAPLGSDVLGNTKPEQSEEKRIAASKKWCFTLNNWLQGSLDLILSKIQKDEYLIGKEIGENGTPHLQGYIKFKTKSRPMEKFKEIPQIHWEKCKGTEIDNIKYCSKDGDYVTNIPMNKIRAVTRELDLITELRPYQQFIVDLIKEEPDNRTIYWFYEETGNVGKTQLSKYLTAKYGAVPLEGKKNDILYCAAEFESEIYIYDIERSIEDYVSYSSIEKIKNGYFMCAKYESKPICRNSPHVIIFANFLPDAEQLSLDRWCIYNITEKWTLKTVSAYK